MRIAIVNWSRRKVGGVETYLNTVIPELVLAGHEIALWYEVDEPAEREQISFPDESVAWCVAELGVERALAALRDWQPDVIYVHKVQSPELESEVLGIAPAVFFAHDYNGTCISGSKTFKYPHVQPCNRRFGWQCLLHYYPHRCGGLSPFTMLKLYDVQSRRLKNLRRYEAIVTHSNHMLTELIKHGLSPQRAYSFPYYVQPARAADALLQQSNGPIILDRAAPEAVKAQALPLERSTKTYWHLLFSGRMEQLKGGHILIDALPLVAAGLGKKIRATFAGDGRARAAWQARAERASHAELEIEFTGWANRLQVSTLLEGCDLLVMPSLWPEPFGLVGPEAGLYGVPVAAFAVGGIPDWLVDGVNGYLAPGNPPTAEGLSQVIIRSLRDPLIYEQLRRGAFEVAQQFNIKNHLRALLEVFASITSNH